MKDKIKVDNLVDLFWLICYNVIVIEEIIPSKENIDYWIKTLLPSKDVWFFKQKPNFYNVEIIDMANYLREYDSLEYINSYFHWLVKKNAKYVIIDETNWILSLTDKERNFVYKEQIELERGLIIENTSSLSNNKEIADALCDNNIILSNSIFNSLDYALKEQLAIAYAKEQDNWTCYDIKIENTKLNAVKNSFINNEGTNCLAIVLYAITLDDKYLTSWVKQKEFNCLLADYNVIEKNKLEYGDVLIFYDDNNTIHHSCFALGNNLFLNKSGQSKFNPVVVQSYENIVNDWQGLNLIIKRKRIKNDKTR